MATIRRLYLYAVLFVSLLAVVWGVIGVLNAVLDAQQGETDLLASSLSIALVAAPIFALHWWLALRGVQRDPEEAQARTRAVFLYAALLATLIPALQNGMLLIERFFLYLFGLPSFRTMLVGDDTWSGGLVTIVINLLAAGYFFFVVQQTWQALPGKVDEFWETRRLYRFAWVFFSLILCVLGLQKILTFLFTLTGGFSRSELREVAAGLALLAGGAPVWSYWDRRIRASLSDVSERFSTLRLAALYLLVFAGAILLLVSTVLVLEGIFRPLLEGQFSLGSIFSRSGVAIQVSLLIALAPFWIHYHRILKNTIIIQGSQPVERSAAEATTPARRAAYQPRQSALLRTYTYFMAFLGLFSGILGVQNLLAALVILLTSGVNGDIPLMERLSSFPAVIWLSSGLALFIVGVPLWWVHWRQLTREAIQEGEAGDHARRSLVRKIYLYLILFAGVIGSMISAGRILYLVLQSALGQPALDALADTLHAVRLLVVFAGLGLYHGLRLRSDLRQSVSVLARRHAQFPVLVLTPEPPPLAAGEEPGSSPSGLNTAFGDVVVAALQQRAPSLPVAVHPAEQGAPDETLSAARAVILPSGLLSKPSEGLRLWLQGFSGARVVIPTPAPDWYWTGKSARALDNQARQAAQIVGRLAEGEDVSSEGSEGGSPIWQTLAYGLVALFVLQIVFCLMMIIASNLVQ